MMHAQDRAPVARSFIQQFRERGFAVMREAVDGPTREALTTTVDRLVRYPEPPLEYEADVGYPGAPSERAAPGGATLRRVLQVYDRDPIFSQWVNHPAVVRPLTALFDERPFLMVRAHHNCLMTKHPRYSSDSGWHQDLRYWSYRAGQLVTVWLALGEEHQANGALRVIPGSHRRPIAAERLNAAQFLRDDHPDNAACLAKACPVTLSPGDVLFFHARLFHAAPRNRTETPKYSLVFTFRAADDEPLAGSRSASRRDVPIGSALASTDFSLK